MKRLPPTPDQWRYHLNATEVHLLRSLLMKFPFTAAGQVEIARTDADPQAAERARLLQEALAEHRQELKCRARILVTDDHFRPWQDGQLLTLDSEARERLLQILNDIRVGCWHALGSPDALEPPPCPADSQHLAYRHLMDLAGYFEQGLLEPDQ
jgi:hypothetical protein